MYSITRFKFCLQNKEFQILDLACNSIIEFQIFVEAFKIHSLTILNMKNEKMKFESISSDPV